MSRYLLAPVSSGVTLDEQYIRCGLQVAADQFARGEQDDWDVESVIQDAERRHAKRAHGSTAHQQVPRIKKGPGGDLVPHRQREAVSRISHVATSREIDSLSYAPFRAEPQPQYGENTRRITVGNYVVFYEATHLVRILKIFPGARKWEDLL
jgi:plasmid stabilization system protein ParE